MKEKFIGNRMRRSDMSTVLGIDTTEAQLNLSHQVRESVGNTTELDPQECQTVELQKHNCLK